MDITYDEVPHIIQLTSADPEKSKKPMIFKNLFTDNYD